MRAVQGEDMSDVTKAAKKLIKAWDSLPRGESEAAFEKWLREVKAEIDNLRAALEAAHD
jgi:hypothetical protein